MQLAEMKWPEVEAVSKDLPVVVPLAALEQHGHHLPLFTDSMLLGEIMGRAAERLGGRAIFAPLTWLGNSDHHLDFPGTLSAPPRVYLDLLAGLAENLLRHGFRRIVFINGHGGNDVPGKQALFEVRQRHRDRSDLLLLFATYWSLGDPSRLAKMGTRQGALLHACEFETSMILRLAPRLVGPIAELEPVNPGSRFDPAYRAWTTKDRSVPGHIGQPREAKAELGEALFALYTDGVAELIERACSWNGRDWR